MNVFEQKMIAVVDALDAFELLLTPDRPGDLGAFVRGRIGLSRAVAGFLSEEWANLPQNLGSERAGGAELEVLHRAFVALRADYSRHISRWDNASLVRDWAGYRRGCQHLIFSMRELLKARAVAMTPRAA